MCVISFKVGISRFFPILLLLLALLPELGFAASASVIPESKRVLILYNQEKGHPAHDLTDQGIRAGFAAKPGFDVKFFTDYLDTGRFPSPSHAALTTDYLHSKYADLKFDVIIAVYPGAMEFLLAEGRTLFPGIPVVACAITRSYAEKLEQSPARRFSTGVIFGDNATEVITAALQLKADTRHVALIAGTTPNDTYGEQIIRKSLNPFLGKIDLIDLTKLSMAETLLRVSSLPPRTIVFYSSIFIDGAGQRFVPKEVAARIAQAANAPVFGLYDTYFGQGIVGGKLVSLQLQGTIAAEQALRVMVGEAPAAIPFGGEEAYVNAYDWRELKRWHIPVSAIPAGAEIRYRELTLWEEYRWYVIGAVSLTMVETVLIFVLVINLKRRRKAEQELSESQLRLNLAVESAEAGLWTLNMDTGHIWATDKTQVMYGFLPGDTVNRESFLAIVHDDDRKLVIQTMNDAVQTRMPFNLEYRITPPDGKVRWLAVRGRFRSTPEMAVGLAGVSINITESKEALLKLLAEQAFTNTLLESLPGIYYLYSTHDMRLIRWNKNHETVTGFSGDELYQRHALDWVEPADRDALAKVLATLMEQGSVETEVRLLTKSGKIIPFQCFGILFSEGDTQYFMGVGFDISARKQMEMDLEQKRNELTHVTRVSMIGQLAATLAHELNQPLGAILRNAEAAELFLQDPTPDIGELRAIMADIRKDDQRAGKVIDRVHGLMKQHKAEQCLLDLDLLLGEVMSMVQSDADKRHVRLSLDIDTARSQVTGDRVQLQQVLINLLLNAFDSLEGNLPDSPVVKVNARVVGATVEFAVSDNGPGIAADKMLQIFEPFVTSKPSGLGMGLAISRGIIEAHGGQLWAKNTEAGGATFTFSLPIVVEGNS